MRKLIVYTSGGLCNRLRPISTAVRLAELLNRELWIYFEGNFRCPITFNKLFENNHNFIYSDELSKLENCVIAASPYDILQEEMLFGRTILKSLANNPKNRICNVGCDAVDYTIQDENMILFSSYFFRQVERIESVKYLKTLKPIASIQNRINEFAEKYKIDKKAIGAHVRGTDINYSIKEYDTQFRKIEVDKKFFICSDDKQYEDYFYNKYRSRAYRTEKKNYAYKNDNKIDTYIDNTALREDAIIEGVIDLYLLAKTDIKIYFGNSSFSQIALLMSQE